MNDRLTKDFINAIKEEKKKPAAYDTQAIVQRVEGRTAWVHIPGGVDETPVKLTTSAKKGDTVQVRVGGGRAWITGNESAPPTDDTKANEAKSKADVADVKAVAAKDIAEVADVKAVAAKETAEAILIYDHTYVYAYEDSENPLVPTSATFTAHVYKGGVDVAQTEYSAEDFTWYRKTEDREEPLVDPTSHLPYGYQMTVFLADCGYGAEIIGKFTVPEDANALTNDGDALTDSNDTSLSVRASGDAVRVRDLSASSVIFDTDRLLVVGGEDEHLVSMSTLQDYLNTNLDKQVLFNTTAVWNAQATLQSEAGTIYVYTDHYVDDDNNVIAGIKVGDGNAYLIDLPFTDDVLLDHISDSSVHITNEERVFWNNKVSVYYGSNETAIFTTASIL